MNAFYPEPITSLPEADIPFEGVRGWLSQGPDHQVVFFWGTVFRKRTWLMDFFF